MDAQWGSGAVILLAQSRLIEVQCRGLLGGLLGGLPGCKAGKAGQGRAGPGLASGEDE